MKKIFSSVAIQAGLALFGVAATGLTTSTLMAEETTVLTIKIPFQFVAGEDVLPAVAADAQTHYRFPTTRRERESKSAGATFAELSYAAHR